MSLVSAPKPAFSALRAVGLVPRSRQPRAFRDYLVACGAAAPRPSPEGPFASRGKRGARVTILEACRDEELFARWFRKGTRDPWFAF